MTELWREMLRGIVSGEALATSAALFDAAFLAFLAATVCYLVFVGARREGAWQTGFAFGIVAGAAMTAALALRWIAAGWAHPPFTNMYESLVFFVWGIIVVYLVVEWRWRVKIAGAFVLPLACVAMGLASLSPDKGIEPLVPALQSAWLHIHVAVAGIGYAAFLTAFVFAVLFLFRDGVRMPWFAAVAAGFAIFAVLAASHGAVVSQGAFPMDKVVAETGGWSKIPLAGGPEGQYEKTVVPGAGPLMAATLFLAIAALGAAAAALRRPAAGAGDRFAAQCLVALFAMLTISLGWLFWTASDQADTRLAANPYSLALLILAWLFLLLAVVFQARRDALLAALPAADALDRLGYKAVMVGFPLMTLVIVTGAIWANKAWGRPWGWDPKETASLVTWIIYLLYLHTRLTQGWTGRRSNLIAIVGFLSVVFTYLGVNLLLSGLHAYASG
jgi:ABC-type transport system involved in cytochrome c biogenesis permease subunit